MRRIFVIVVSLVASDALAESPELAGKCADSFAARLDDAKHALVEYELAVAEAEKARPAVEWFNAHCRFLERDEIVRRKVDDQAAFVCDPKATGRPANLTAELVLDRSTLPAINQAQRFHGDNVRCAEADRAGGRITLVLRPDATALEKLELACFADERPSCVKARESIAAARAKGAR